MDIVCLDLEGVLVPEIWIAFAEESGIPELKKTTRDEPDYDKLMNWRLGILKEHGLGLKEIQETIAKIDPLPGAKEFLDKLREMGQVIIISDTFTQFAKPLMKKLGWPTIFCNSLEVAPDGTITGFKMRIEKSKYTTVKALQSIGLRRSRAATATMTSDESKRARRDSYSAARSRSKRITRSLRHMRHMTNYLMRSKRQWKRNNGKAWKDYSRYMIPAAAFNYHVSERSCRRLRRTYECAMAHSFFLS